MIEGFINGFSLILPWFLSVTEIEVFHWELNRGRNIAVGGGIFINLTVPFVSSRIQQSYI